MCLTKVDKEPKQYKRKVGYKVVHVDSEGRLSPEYGDLHLSYPVGKWVGDPHSGKLLSQVATPPLLLRTDYPAGFHIFRTLRAAKLWKQFSESQQVRKVDFNGVVATGSQEISRGPHLSLVRVVVASRIRVRRGAINEL